MDMSTHSWALSPWWLPGRPGVGAHGDAGTDLVGPADGRQVDVVELGHALAQVRGHGVDDRLVAEQQLARADRGHDEGAGAGDAGEGVVVREGAVLDAVDARLDRVEDALERVGVRGDGLEAGVGHLHGGPQLVEPVLDGPGVLGLRREHRARRHHLDEVGAVRELAADRPPHLVRRRRPPRTCRGSTRPWRW